ncbi:MAG: hypothetical protein LBP71_05255 [Spirochaetaceae bacterium]|jgi:hypothetical protein|nr:hypothetical protein [Spirochaetaceae bacterium]
MNVQKIEDELLRLEYPFLSPDYDPDIERYFELRNSHRPQDALAIYQTRLKPRYPQDEFRALLMRCYRSRDPAYKAILARAYRNLGARALDRVRKTIVYIVEKVESYNERDVISTIKAADDILLALPKDHYEAQAGIERLLHYAEELDFYVKSMTKAVELIHAYLNQSLSVVEEAISRRENQRQQELERERQRQIREDWKSYSRQKKRGRRISRPHPMIDLAAIQFSPDDLARIEISGDMIKPEDQTLAYCIKYWNHIHDSAFEQLLYFYSKKYGTKHHGVYMAIRRGRANNFRDDEILASVMSVLVTGYYYSIRGDVYLQMKWTSIKSALEQQASREAAPQSRPETAGPRMVFRKTKSRRAGTPAKSGKASKVSPAASPPSAFRRKPRKPSRIAPPRPVESAGAVVPPQAAPALSRPKRPPPALTRAKARVKTLPIRSRGRAKPAAGSPVRARAAPAPPKTAVQAKAISASAGSPVRAKPAVQARAAPVSSKPAVQAKPAPMSAGSPVRAKAPPAPAKPAVQARAASAKPAGRRPSGSQNKPSGSVSDRLRELSGRSYDVYQDRFLSRVRGAIRKVMGSGKRLFFTLPGAAEDLVYNFLKNHYSDPYMNWEESQEKKDLEKLGFTLDSIVPIIDECYHRL